MAFEGQKAGKHTQGTASVTAIWFPQGAPPWGFLATSGKGLSASATKVKINRGV